MTTQEFIEKFLPEWDEEKALGFAEYLTPYYHAYFEKGFNNESYISPGHGLPMVWEQIFLSAYNDGQKAAGIIATDSLYEFKVEFPDHWIQSCSVSAANGKAALKEAILAARDLGGSLVDINPPADK